MKNQIKVIVGILLIVIGGCKVIEPPDPYESEDFSRFFSNQKVDAALLFYSDLIANTGYKSFYSNQVVYKIMYNQQVGPCDINKGIYKVEGLKFCDFKNHKLVRSIFAKPSVQFEFVGDTLDLPTIKPFTMEPPKPFTMLTVSDNHIEKGEDLTINWSIGTGEKKSMALAISCYDLYVPDSLRRLSIWHKIVDDNGIFTIPSEVFDRLPAKGRYDVTLLRANNAIENNRNPIQIRFTSTARYSFSKDF